MRRVEIVMILGSVGLLLIVLELVRRRRLKEEYSLLWLLTAVVLLALSLLRSSLDLIAKLLGIFYPPTALFVVGFGFVLLLLLYSSEEILVIFRHIFPAVAIHTAGVLYNII